MAKKKNDNIGLDDINFDDENFDFDFDPSNIKDDRKPITKLTHGAVKGFKDSFTNTDFIKKKVLEALPPGYTKASDLLDDISSSASDLYNSTAKELGPVKKLGLRTTKQLLPKLKGKLPKKLEDKLQSILDDNESSRYSSDNQQDSNIALELGEIFKTQMEQQEQLDQKSEVRENVKTALDLRKHKDSIAELSGIRSGIDKLTSYQDSVNFKFQKKSLELQFKQYYIQKQHLELSSVNSKNTLDLLTNIQKNTGLPDHAKVNTSELARTMLKERMLKAAGGKLSDFKDNYLQNLGKNVKRKIGSVTSAAAMAADAAMMMDPEDLRAMGVDPTEMVGGMLGEHFAENLTSEMINKYKHKIPYLSKIKKTGNFLSRTINELPANLDQYSRTASKREGVKGTLENLFKSFLPRFSYETSLTKDTLSDTDKATPFDVQTRKSIVEIIPGYLSRILQSIDIMRTGDSSIEPTVYDITKGKFTGKGDLNKSIKNTLISSKSKENVNMAIDEIIDQLGIGKELNKKQKASLKRQMLSDAVNNKKISLSNYSKIDTYGDNVSKEDAKHFAKVFKKLNDNQSDDGEFKDLLSEKSSYLSNYMPGHRELSQQLINVGYGDLLEELGYSDGENLNIDKIIREYIDDAPGGLPGKKKKTLKGKKSVKGKKPVAKSKNKKVKAKQNQIASKISQIDNIPSSVEDDCCDRLINYFIESNQLDKERNNKLDELLLRFDVQSSGIELPQNISTQVIKERAKNLYNSSTGKSKQAYAKIKAIQPKRKIKETIDNLKNEHYDNTLTVQENLNNLKDKAGKSKTVRKAKIKGKKLGKKLKKAVDVYLPNETLPRITYAGLLGGNYFNAKTGELITKVNDIKDGVIDLKGRLVLSKEEITEGPVDQDGEAIHVENAVSAEGIKDFIEEINENGYKAAGKKLLGKAKSKISDKIKEKLSLEGKQTVALTEIKEILDDRLKDETTDRAGSYEDIVERRKKGRLASIKDKFKEGMEKGKEAKKGGIMGLLAGLGTTLMGLTSTITSMVTGPFKLLIGVGKGLWTVTKLLGKSLPMIFKGMKFAGKVGWGATKLAGRVAMGAGRLALSGASWLASGGAATIASGVASAAGAVASGVGAVVSFLGAPVILGALAVAGAIYGGIKLYKYLKNKTAFIGKIRMNQYGVDHTDKDKVSKIGDLESYLADKVQGGANPSFKLDKDSAEKIFGIFDFKVDDREKVQAFGQWFDRRFKPVYMKHYRAMDLYAKGSNLQEADDKVPLKSKLEYIKKVDFVDAPDSPYNVTMSPFDFTNSLPQGREAIQKITDEATVYYKEEMEKEGIKVDSKGVVSGAAVKKDSMAMVVWKYSPMGLMASASKFAAGLAIKSIKTTVGLLAKGLEYTLPGFIGKKIWNYFFGDKPKPLDALLSIRLKCYGLKDFKEEYVKPIMKLEHSMLAKCRLGKDKEPTINVDATAVFNEYFGDFGLDGKSPSDHDMFALWFTSRFIPVILKYYGLVRNISATLSISDADEKLKPSQKAAIGKELVAAKNNENKPIWDVKAFPIPKADVNTDPDSCKEHIKFLEGQTDSKELKSQSAVVKKEVGSGKSIGDKLKDLMSNTKDKIVNAASNAVDALKNKANDIKNSVSGAYNKAVDAVSGGIEATANYLGGNSGGNTPINPDAPKGAAVKAYAPLLDVIASGESGKAGYDAVYSGSKIKPNKPISTMTIGEVIKYQKDSVRAGSKSSAVGRYQFIRKTLEATCKRLGLSENDLFNAENQDRCAIDLLNANKTNGLNSWLSGKGSDGGLQNWISSQWASVKNTSGRGTYDGDGLNHAGIGSIIAYAKQVKDNLTGKNGEAVAQTDATPTKPDNAVTAITPPNNAPIPSSDNNGVKSNAQIGEESTLAAAGIGSTAPAGPSDGATPTTTTTPTTDQNVATATATQSINASAAAVNDQVTQQSNMNQNYQAVSMDVQRKASSDYLNGGIDNMSGVLTDQLNVQRSIDANIKQLLQLIAVNGTNGLSPSTVQNTPLQTVGNNFNKLQQPSTVTAPVSMKRINV